MTTKELISRNTKQKLYFRLTQPSSAWSCLLCLAKRNETVASLDRSQITGFGTLAYIFILNKLKGCGLETNNLHLHLYHMIQSSKTSCFYNYCLHSKFLLKNRLQHSLQVFFFSPACSSAIYKSICILKECYDGIFVYLSVLETEDGRRQEKKKSLPFQIPAFKH